MKYVSSLWNIEKEDSAIAGGKGASLGEMIRAGFPVPPGFVVLSSAFDVFLKGTGLNAKVELILESVIPEDTGTIEKASENIRSIILAAAMPREIEEEIRKSFNELGSEYVAVRSSATAEDSAVAAWAGQLESFLNTNSEDLPKNVKSCWASLFTPRAITYRLEKGLGSQSISVAVVVQEMVESDTSGIAFSVHPVTHDVDRMFIEAGYGLGEAIVSGQVTPDSYEVRKDPMEIVDKNIQSPARGLYRSDRGGNEWHDVPAERKGKAVLSDAEIIKLSDIVVGIEGHYGFPCDIEWAIADGRLYVVQSRPITTLAEKLVTVEKLLLMYKEVNVCGLTMSVNVSGWIDEWLSRTCRVGSFGSMACRFRGYEMDFYVDKGQYEKAHFEIVRQIEAGTYPIEFSTERSMALGDRILSIVRSGRSVWEAMDPGKVCEIFSEVFDCSRKLCSYGYIAPLSDFPYTFISSRMQEILEARHASDAAGLKIFLSTPEARRPMMLANEEMFRIIAEQGDLGSWLQRWFWIDFGHIGAVLTDASVREKYKLLFDDPKRATTELQNISAEYGSLEEKQEKNIGELGFSDEERRIFRYAREITFLKGYRADVLSAANAFFDAVFEIYSKRLGIGKDVFRFATKEEVVALISGSDINVAEILERKDYSIWLYTDNASGILIHTGEQARQFEADHLAEEHVVHEGKVIKGNVAYPGIVEGTVRIVNSLEDLKKMNRGEILVSTQTTPELLPAMSKAAAFIADVGGIISHAAIVAREMKKPCIIGTEIASKVLRDGDRVRVDANSGVIEII
ncbi:MAG: hypothetical protein HGB37_01855 [Candidatus Moranbacteria bacterium]|nr:hypothetical protein [Candidatus Moranbacteria bacterium]